MSATPSTPPPGEADVAATVAALTARAGLDPVRPLTLVVDDPTVAAALASAAADRVRVDLAPGDLPADAAITERVRDLRHAVLGASADLGIVVETLTGADVAVPAVRVRVLDENGEPVDPAVVAALVALPEVAALRAPGRTPVVVHDVLTSRALPDLLDAAGARTVRVATGTGPLTAALAAEGAALALGHDGLVAIADRGSLPGAEGRPDLPVAGLLAVLHVLAAVGARPHPLSVLAELHQPYVGSGELVVPVTDADAARERVVEAYVERRGAGEVAVDDLDGLTVSHWDGTPAWWFHLRTDRTGSVDPAAQDAPVLRLRVEAADEDIMEKVRDDLLALARQEDR